MELWIRSQDKRELRPNPKLGLDKLKDEYYIVDRYDFERAIILGVYKTEQRALEVLDEIHSKIVNLQLVSLEEKGQARKDAIINDKLKCVYVMPKD